MLRVFILMLLQIAVVKITIGQVPIPTPSQLAWVDAEIGVLISYDLHVFDGKRYDQPKNRITPIADYNIFNPEKLDTDQWILASKNAGATFAILTVTHETGFALYQSDFNPYCLKALKWKDGKGDIMRDFIASCKKYEVKPAIYIGIRWNSYMGIHDFYVDGKAPISKNRQTYYNTYCENITRELTSKYGDFFFIWFDGGAHGPEQGGADLLPIITANQPDAIFYHNLQRADVRWGGSESGTVPYPCWSTFDYPSWFQHSDAKNDFKAIKYGQENGAYFMPAMADAPLRGYKGKHEWFWEPGDEGNIFPVSRLMDMYEKSIGRNANLIIGLTPDADGLIPQPDTDTLKAFGELLKATYGKALFSFSSDKKEIELPLPNGVKFDKIVIAEDLKAGQRVRAFSVQVKQKGKWVTIAEGTSIGNKFIKKLDTPISGQRIRLLIPRSVNGHFIKELSLY
jgi:alpha-L-fucosidase